MRTITTEKAQKTKNDGEGQHDGDEPDRRRERRRSKHGRSKSRSHVPESVLKKLQNVREMVQHIPGVPKPLEKAAPTSYTDSPFSDDIALVEIPKRFTVPNMKPYNGSSDPQDHIAQYKQRMFMVHIPQNLREPCMCKGFGSTLSGPVLHWFVNLPNRSISSFTVLVDAFNLQFSSSRLFEKTTSDLYKIVRRYREPLQDYLTRFNREKVTITSCDIPTAIEAFRRGLERDSSL